MGLVRFILSLIVGAVCVWIVYLMSKRILPGARTATNSTKANQATTWIEQGVSWYPIALLLIAFFGVLVYSIYSREMLR